MKVNAGYYIQQINQIVTKTEKIGETMHPDFEKIREAIDQKKLSELSKEDYAAVYQNFLEGTTLYKELLTKLQGLKAPAKVMGIHVKLKKAYEEYTVACGEMVDSVNVNESGEVNVSQFDESEARQDKATDTISFCIQRMTKTLMK